MILKSPPLISAKAARALDEKARLQWGLPTLILMENAGRGVAEEVLKLIGKGAGRKIALFCGRGNNGGDGFVAVRHLLAHGLKPDIYLAGKKDAVEAEAGVNLDIILRMKQKVTEVREGNLVLVKKALPGYSLIIDALLGVGLRGEVRGIIKDIIQLINAGTAYTIAVDLPSGLDADTGRILGCCVRADMTVTFAAGKQGMAAGDGPNVCGTIVVKNLGVPL